MTGRVASLKIQQWGNSLAVRIPAPVARAVRFSVGQAVEVAVHDDGVSIRRIGGPKTTLEQKLALFNPELHGSESLPGRPVGAEAI